MCLCRPFNLIQTPGFCLKKSRAALSELIPCNPGRLFCVVALGFYPENVVSTHEGAMRWLGKVTIHLEDGEEDSCGVKWTRSGRAAWLAASGWKSPAGTHQSAERTWSFSEREFSPLNKCNFTKSAWQCLCFSRFTSLRHLGCLSQTGSGPRRSACGNRT